MIPDQFLAYRIKSLTGLFLKEHLKEPIGAFWGIISPAAIFYMFNIHSKAGLENYVSTSSFFFAYVISTVAFFGYGFYIIGRRESGFSRSFIYGSTAKIIFHTSHFIAYLLIGFIHCTLFYLLTKPFFGDYILVEYGVILGRFLGSYVLLCTLSIALTLIPLGFQNANTFLSVLSFCMVTTCILAARTPEGFWQYADFFNPLSHIANVMSYGFPTSVSFYISISILMPGIFFTCIKYMRINPVWSRY